MTFANTYEHFQNFVSVKGCKLACTMKYVHKSVGHKGGGTPWTPIDTKNQFHSLHVTNTTLRIRHHKSSLSRIVATNVRQQWYYAIANLAANKPQWRRDVSEPYLITCVLHLSKHC